MANNLLHGGTTNDEGFKSLSEELFEQIFRANPDMSLNGTVIAAINAKKSNAEILEQHVKDKDEDEDLTAQMVEAGETILSESARQAEELRRHQEAWDNAPSSEYPGLNNKEVLAGLRLICGNLPYYTDMAVKKGWIKEEDKEKFAKYMRDELWLKEQERNKKTNSPEYIAKKQEHENEKKANPDFVPAAKNILNATKGMGINVTAANTQGQTANLQTGANSIDAGLDALNINAEDDNNDPSFKAATRSILDVSNEQNLKSVNLQGQTANLKTGENRIVARLDALNFNAEDAKGVLRVGDPDLKIIAQPQSIWREGDDYKGDKRDFLQPGEDDVVTNGALKTSGLSLTNEFNQKAPIENAFVPIKTAEANNTVQLNQVKPAQFSQSNGMI